MTETLRVAVSFQSDVGYISEANHRVPWSLTALSLDGLRRRIVVLILSRKGRRDRPVLVHLDLDAAAQGERDRRGAERVRSADTGAAQNSA